MNWIPSCKKSWHKRRQSRPRRGGRVGKVGEPGRYPRALSHGCARLVSMAGLHSVRRRLDRMKPPRPSLLCLPSSHTGARLPDPRQGPCSNERKRRESVRKAQCVRWAKMPTNPGFTLLPVSGGFGTCVALRPTLCGISRTPAGFCQPPLISLSPRAGPISPLVLGRQRAGGFTRNLRKSGQMRRPQHHSGVGGFS